MKLRAGDNLLRLVSEPARAASLLTGLLLAGEAAAQTATVNVNPDADAFVWSAQPTNNFGGAGALSVSGSASFNGFGQTNGPFDTLMRFSLSNVVASLDQALGTNNWIVTGIKLVLNENATPNNAIFNRGAGGFEVFRLAADGWVEGTGMPRMPTTDGVTWNDLPGIVNSNSDVSLGIFTNAGVSGPMAFPLALADPVLIDIHQAGEIGLHLTAASPNIGFTFNSRNYSSSSARPQLEVTGAVSPKPLISEIVLGGGYVSVNFATAPNWTYRLQAAGSLGASGPSNWSDLLVVPAQPAPGNVSYQDGVTNQQRFYRLTVSP